MIFLLTVASSSLLVGLLIEWGWSISQVLGALGGTFIVAIFYIVWVQKIYKEI
jgi:hypothetical protein